MIRVRDQVWESKGNKTVGQQLCAAVIARNAQEALTDAVVVVSDRRLSVAAVAALLGRADAAAVDAARGIDDVVTLCAKYNPAIVIGDNSWESAGLDPSPVGWTGAVAARPRG